MSVFRKLFPLCLWITVLASALLCAGVIVGNLRFWALGFCHWLAPVTLAAGLLFLFLVWFYRDRLDALAQGRFPMLAGTVLALCLAVKLTWVLTHPIAPSVDYATFHGLAAKLAESWRIESGSYLDQYIPTFPHIFGYSSFLSLFYMLTGPSPMTAAVVNVLLSCLSCMCLLRLGARLHSPLCGLGAGLAWTLLPSQTVYNMFVLSEPWYTFLILLAACCALEFRQFTQLRHNLALAVALGLILALIQASRPVAAIGLILMGIWLFFIRCPSCGREALAQLGLLALTCAVFLLANELTSFILGQRIGTDPAQSVGYSLAVGLNEDSGGVWNPSDSEYLTSRMYAGGDYDPEALQLEMQSIAFDRAKSLLSRPHALLKLLQSKFQALLVNDSSCVFYAGGALSHPGAMEGLCDGAWLLLWMAALPGLALLPRRRKYDAWLLVWLFVLGLTAAQMLVEVAGRYHYALTPALCLLASFSVASLPRKRRPTQDMRISPEPGD